MNSVLALFGLSPVLLYCQAISERGEFAILVLMNQAHLMSTSRRPAKRVSARALRVSCAIGLLVRDRCSISSPNALKTYEGNSGTNTFYEDSIQTTDPCAAVATSASSPLSFGSGNFRNQNLRPRRQYEGFGFIAKKFIESCTYPWGLYIIVRHKNSTLRKARVKELQGVLG